MKGLILIFISILTVSIALWLPAISQDPEYHNFADQVEILGIPNFLNVMSNFLFLWVGLIGVRFVLVSQQVFNGRVIQNIYLVFFIAVIFVGLGSAYYHLSPDNLTLIWDRLPMSIAFMSFFIVILYEYVSKKLAFKLALPLLMSGLLSVVYWYWSELQGHGDLRFYGVVQFLPLVLIPVILLSYSSRIKKTWLLWALLGFYLVAKVFELMDYPVYQLTQFVSGHTIKHLVSAGGPYMLYLVLNDLEINSCSEKSGEF